MIEEEYEEAPEAIAAKQATAERSRASHRKSGLLATYECVLCDRAPVTAVRNGPEAYRVCAYHYEEYAKEGKKYLPFEERIVYQRIIEAGRRKKEQE